MFSKAKNEKDGYKYKLLLLFYCLNILIAFGLGVISAQMSSNGCSRSFISAAIYSFIYVVLNCIFICWPKSIERWFNLINIFTLINILIASLVALGYTFQESTCQIIACYNGEGSQIDSFYKQFNGKNKSSFENDYCDQANNKQIGEYISQLIAKYAGEKEFDRKKIFYILKAWPISFLILQSLLIIIHMTQIFIDYYRCNCKDICDPDNIQN
ncbi:hypothetical protein ABPG72_018146 [Tetrahymena utriculariae]